MITVNKIDGTKKMFNGNFVSTVEDGNGMSCILMSNGTQICVKENAETVTAAVEANSGTLTEFAL